MKLLHLRVLLLFFMPLFFASCGAKKERKVLVFSKTAGYRHAAIPAGQKALMELGKKNDFATDTTEDASAFTEENLKQYSAVVFLCTTGDVLNFDQQRDFERFIQAGGGYVGIHAAADTEYEWGWYGKLVGGYFQSHPPGLHDAEITMVDNTHASTKDLPAVWKRNDEWYNYKKLSPDINVLLNLDEKTYEGGENGENHPIAWYQEFDGGRSFYSGGGHTNESYADPLFLGHILGGINYVLDGPGKDYAKVRSLQRPRQNRFEKVVLANHFNEPTELQVIPGGGGKVLFTERKGDLKLYDPISKEVKVVGNIDVFTDKEYGLMGLASDPDFKNNHFIYLYYTPVGDELVQHLSRFKFQGDTLDKASEKVILKVPVQRVECCHTGGSIEFGPDGLLYLSTGDDTNPFGSEGFSPADGRPGKEYFDARGTSGNSQDLRGKILRIKVKEDATYDIPEGNLFADAKDGRPEIYVMGCRNPYRIAIDQKKNWLYWGDVGPDAGEDVEGRGPRGYDEVNQAQKAGFFGWPLFVGNNYAYNAYDFETKVSGKAHDPAAPVNDSPNNTGLKNLPPANPAYIWYPYAKSPDFPILHNGKGGRNAMAGPTYYYDDFPDNPKKMPKYYDGRFLMYEWMRGYIMAVEMDENGKLLQIEPMAEHLEFNNIMDMQLDEDGTLYIIEYGTQWFSANPDARLVRIEFNSGNRAPEITASADKTAGGLPLTVNFSSEGSEDPDNDKMTIKWKFTDTDESTEADPSFTFEKAGVYNVVLEITDEKGNASSEEIEIKAGNSVPEVALKINGNSMFFLEGASLNYSVSVTDAEDGSTAEGSIDTEKIAVTVDFVQRNVDEAAKNGHQTASAAVGGKQLIDDSGCMTCHKLNDKSVGPSYSEVAEKYKSNTEALERLTTKVRKGGTGVWGEHTMPAHPQLSKGEVGEMVAYILGLGEEKQTYPHEGEIVLDKHDINRQRGAYIVRAVYADKGAEGVGTLTGVETKVLRFPTLGRDMADKFEGIGQVKLAGNDVPALNGKGFVSFKEMDFTGIKSIKLKTLALQKATVEIRLDGPDGKLLGSQALSPTGAPADIRIPISAVNGPGKLCISVVGGAKTGEPAVALLGTILSGK